MSARRFGHLRVVIRDDDFPFKFPLPRLFPDQMVCIDGLPDRKHPVIVQRGLSLFDALALQQLTADALFGRRHP